MDSGLVEACQARETSRVVVGGRGGPVGIVTPRQTPCKRKRPAKGGTLAGGLRCRAWQARQGAPSGVGGGWGGCRAGGDPGAIVGGLSASLLLPVCRFILSAVARSDIPLTPRPTMDEPEADYLRQQIREFRRSNTRWKAVALVSLATLALLVLAGGGTLLTGGMFMAAERARAAEMEARMQAEEARMQAERAMQAEREARMRAEDDARQKEVDNEAAPAKR